MRVTKNLGMLLLAIWLILYGLSALFGLSFQGLPVIMAILALAAGILILLGRYAVWFQPPFWRAAGT